MKRHGLTFNNVRDGDGEIFASFNVGSQPAWVFQSKTGERVLEPRVLSDQEIDSQLTAIAQG